MWPVRVWNPGPLTYESGALPTALPGSATLWEVTQKTWGQTFLIWILIYANILDTKNLKVLYSAVSCKSSSSELSALFRLIIFAV